MFIHFAFGTLGKKEKVKEQTYNVIEHILKRKRLKVSKCKEFIPAFNSPHYKGISWDSLMISKQSLVSHSDTMKLTSVEPITYLPMDVSMICFIKISLKKLKNSSHSKQYGKFGIVLTDNLLKSKGIKPVVYYTEKSLWKDQIIKKWNKNKGRNLPPEEKKKVEKEILHFRKPAVLFPSFLKSIIGIINSNSDGINLELWTYNRYEEGYNFRDENEYRIVFEKGEDYLYFEEKHIYMIITPDESSKINVEKYLSYAWNRQPQVIVFPS